MSGETAGPSAAGRRRDAIGLREVLFQSIAAMAPAAAVAAVTASIPSGAVFAGGSLPLSVPIALVACLFMTSCVAEPVRERPAAGSVSAYVAPGLRPAVGFLVGWGYVFVEALVRVWMATGVVVLLVLMRRRPGRIAGTARVHLDEPSPTGLPQNGAVQR